MSPIFYGGQIDVDGKIDNPNFRKNRIINFGDGVHLKTAESMVNFNTLNNLLITDETNGKLINGHHGYVGNKIVAQTLINQIVLQKICPNFVLNY